MIHNTFIRYLLIGCFNLLVCIGTMFSVSHIYNHYLIYTMAGYSVAFAFSFFLNLTFTFRVNGDIKKRLLRFVIINLFNLLIVELLQVFLIEFMKIQITTAIILGITWYTLFGYFMNKKFVFPCSLNNPSKNPS